MSYMFKPFHTVYTVSISVVSPPVISGSVIALERVGVIDINVTRIPLAVSVESHSIVTKPSKKDGVI